jgi:hypothetical protein
MSINVWIAQPEALKAEAEALRVNPDGARAEVKGTKAEAIEYAVQAAKIADKTDGFFRTATVAAKAQILESVYVDTVDDIASLEKGGAIILGAWDWNGTRVRDLHASLVDFMPIRKTYDRNGVETGSLPPTIEDVVLVYGQTPRVFT